MKSMKKLSMAVAALAISGALATPASAIPRSELAKIRELIDANKGQELGSYLAENTTVFFDNSPLGLLLFQWFQWTLNSGEVGYFSGLGWEDAIPANLIAMVEASKSDPSLY